MPRLWISCLAAAILAAAGPAPGLTVLPATFDELVHESVAVVHGQVREVQARWTSDRRTIESSVTVDVLDAYKGAATETATFVVPGGQAGGRIVVVPGAPVFAVGDEVVVFLAGRAPAMPRPVGLSLGVYRVVERTPGAGKLVVPSPVSSTPGLVRRGSVSRAPRPLDTFGADVRALGAAR
ncbi:MAG: hypothetical protein AB7O28_04085 [Vicinamibacterales bacterium]